LDAAGAASITSCFLLAVISAGGQAGDVIWLKLDIIIFTAVELELNPFHLRELVIVLVSTTALGTGKGGKGHRKGSEQSVDGFNSLGLP
jgi:hypothetical protein